MSNFPTTFDESRVLPIDQLGDLGRQAVQQLAENGYEVRYGLTPELAEQIYQLSLEPAIREYCPKDSGERFTDLAATEKWLSKGRAAFLLFKVEGESAQLVGYGWAGAGQSEKVPGGETTFAIRIAEAGQGKGLAAPYSRVMISATGAMYDAKNFWLETWQSNGGAVHIYHKLGFQDVSSEAASRPTAEGGTVPDTRLYMSLPEELINP